MKIGFGNRSFDTSPYDSLLWESYNAIDTAGRADGDTYTVPEWWTKTGLTLDGKGLKYGLTATQKIDLAPGADTMHTYTEYVFSNYSKFTDNTRRFMYRSDKTGVYTEAEDGAWEYDENATQTALISVIINSIKTLRKGEAMQAAGKTWNADHVNREFDGLISYNESLERKLIGNRIASIVLRQKPEICPDKLRTEFPEWNDETVDRFISGVVK